MPVAEVYAAIQHAAENLSDGPYADRWHNLRDDLVSLTTDALGNHDEFAKALLVSLAELCQSAVNRDPDASLRFVCKYFPLAAKTLALESPDDDSSWHEHRFVGGVMQPGSTKTSDPVLVPIGQEEGYDRDDTVVIPSMSPVPGGISGGQSDASD